MSTVVAAIDLGPFSERILRHAAGFARLLSARLKVVHVARDPHPDDLKRVLDFCVRHGPCEVDLADGDVVVRAGKVSDAIHREAARAPQLPARAHAFIVRRGSVAEEISHCAVHEGSGLVVMGLRSRPRSTPGAIASAVLKTNRAFVLAVPGC